MFPRVRCGPAVLLSRSGEGREEPAPSAGGRLSATTFSPSSRDFLVAITARFQTLYVFLLMELGPGVSCTAISPGTQRRSGPCNSFERQFQPIMLIAFSVGAVIP